ncbi:disulfide bond formation protein B [Aliiroseovarius sp. KMU-50]|uniref:Disulfide bond formation protein B n=1 Tax=Aliiroseovarius salicola TaxID=3009082 RepID=A0ABT4W351_9RHOB|nr:disulfide bond formation protein B [Aliiroseovarius sp. KMU-50]MDA5094925.1 disulfide bond formation protein B [Aliiroseovarius sp. KMU-50]
MNMIRNLTFTKLVILATAGSIFVLGGAFIFQALGYAPCKLCLWQRWPHAAAIVFGGAALASQKRILAWLGAASAATTSATGVYHSGVERALWEGPTTCSGSSNIGSMSADDLLNSIMTAPLVRCDEIPWRVSDMIPLEILDITMANLNALGSAVFAILWIMAVRKAD